MNTAEAEFVLRAVLPYLVGKRDQAETALLARALVRRGPRQNPNAAALAELYGSLSAMKRERSAM